jgi:hypothetical protein
METTNKEIVRFLYRCGNCNHSWAYDFEKRGKDYFVSNYEHAINPKIYPFIKQSWMKGKIENECPECSSHDIKLGKVSGEYSDHICDSDCTHATGLTCRCKCEGKNHGIAHLIPID